MEQQPLKSVIKLQSEENEEIEEDLNQSISSESSFSEEEIQIKWQKQVKTQIKTIPLDSDDLMDIEEEPVYVEENEPNKPMVYFSKFFSDELISLIMNQSCLYVEYTLFKENNLTDSLRNKIKNIQSKFTHENI